MGPTRYRTVVIAVALAFVGSLIAATVAAACQYPDMTIGLRGPYHPGDSIPFSVSNTDAGATATLHVDGHDISQTDPGGEPGFQGRFELPDLGDSPKTIEIYATIDHDDPLADDPSKTEHNQWTSKQSTIDYEPTPTSPPGGGPGGGGHRPSPTYDQNAPQQSSGSPAGGGSGAGASIGGVPQSGSPTPGSSPSPGGGSAGPTQAQAVVQGAQDSTTMTPHEAAVTTANDRQDRRDGAEVRRLRNRPERVGVPTPAHMPVAVATTGYAVFASLALVLIAGAVGLVLFLARRGRSDDGTLVGGPVWLPPPLQAQADQRSLLVEAELQEMIAEARARQMLRPAEEEIPRSSEAGTRTPSRA